MTSSCKQTVDLAHPEEGRSRIFSDRFVLHFMSKQSRHVGVLNAWCTLSESGSIMTHGCDFYHLVRFGNDWQPVYRKRGHGCCVFQAKPLCFGVSWVASVISNDLQIVCIIIFRDFVIGSLSCEEKLCEFLNGLREQKSRICDCSWWFTGLPRVPLSTSRIAD